jgi:hypothetical protein
MEYTQAGGYMTEKDLDILARQLFGDQDTPTQIAIRAIAIEALKIGYARGFADGKAA